MWLLLSTCIALKKKKSRNVIFCLVFDAYEAIAEMSIEDSIKNELSGDFERLMLAVGKKLLNTQHASVISAVKVPLYE